MILSFIFCLLAFAAVFGGLVFTCDDLFIDACALFYGLRPRELKTFDLLRLNSLPQRRVAIMVANWRESEILERMIIGNLGRIDYREYAFFLGVYANDIETWSLAAALEKKFNNVFVVVNTQPGPTTKGQMLNEVARAILASGAATGINYDLFLMQDSEDVLHPLALKLINEAALEADFIQTPVFSFDVPLTSWTRGTYLEEFSESHTKDLLVREHLGAAVPSAGVGTALSHSLVRLYMEKGQGSFLREDTLTEDYDLGLRTKALGLKSKFVCAYRIDDHGFRDFIATREFFPSKVGTSIRQKTRWTLGIAFQGLDNLGWHGGLVDKYFLFRDRRGPLNGLLILLSATTVIGFTVDAFGILHLPQVLHSPGFYLLAATNGFNMVIRVVQRSRAVNLVHGFKHVLAVPIRWPVGTFINGAAAFKAYLSYRKTKRTGKAAKWEKTVHELPASFGQTVQGPHPLAVPLGPYLLQSPRQAHLSPLQPLSEMEQLQSL